MGKKLRGKDIYIYIYIYRERERERGEVSWALSITLHQLGKVVGLQSPYLGTRFRNRYVRRSCGN